MYVWLEAGKENNFQTRKEKLWVNIESLLFSMYNIKDNELVELFMKQ